MGILLRLASFGSKLNIWEVFSNMKSISEFTYTIYLVNGKDEWLVVNKPIDNYGNYKSFKVKLSTIRDYILTLI